MGVVIVGAGQAGFQAAVSHTSGPRCRRASSPVIIRDDIDAMAAIKALRAQGGAFNQV